jgi:hypothetical protein
MRQIFAEEFCVVQVGCRLVCIDTDAARNRQARTRCKGRAQRVYLFFRRKARQDSQDFITCRKLDVSVESSSQAVGKRFDSGCHRFTYPGSPFNVVSEEAQLDLRTDVIAIEVDR